jgi:enolase
MKIPNRFVSESGAYTCALETPQQSLDMIEASIQAAAGADQQQNIQIALNISASEFFDNVSFTYIFIELKRTDFWRGKHIRIGPKFCEHKERAV